MLSEASLLVVWILLGFVDWTDLSEVVGPFDMLSESVNSINLFSDVPFDRALLQAMMKFHDTLIKGWNFTQNILIVWNIRLNVKDDLNIVYKIFQTKKIKKGKKFLLSKTYDEFWHGLILNLFCANLRIQWNSLKIKRFQRIHVDRKMYMEMIIVT